MGMPLISLLQTIFFNLKKSKKKSIKKSIYSQFQSNLPIVHTHKIYKRRPKAHLIQF